MKKISYLKSTEIKKYIKGHNIHVGMYRCDVEILTGKEAQKLEEDWGNLPTGGGVTRNYLDNGGTILISFLESPVK